MLTSHANDSLKKLNEMCRRCPGTRTHPEILFILACVRHVASAVPHQINTVSAGCSGVQLYIIIMYFLGYP